MKAPSPAPLYATILPVLVETARSLGYALAVHGTLSRDLDLVAVPWVADAAPPEDLVHAIALRVAWTRADGLLIQGPEEKPHGRLAWTIPLVGDAFIDLSVVPVNAPHGTGAPHVTTPVYVVRVPERRLFLRWEGGVAGVELPEGPAFGRLITYTRAEAEALLERARASGQLPDLVARCVIEPHAPEAG